MSKDIEYLNKRVKLLEGIRATIGNWEYVKNTLEETHLKDVIDDSIEELASELQDAEDLKKTQDTIDNITKRYEPSPKGIECLKSAYTGTMFSLPNNDKEDLDLITSFKNGVYHDKLEKLLTEDQIYELWDIANIHG